MRIGFFDSGIGGVSIAQAAMKNLPQYSYVYFADDTHMPYGNKNLESLYQLTTNALETLFAKDCRLVILACNSASSVLPRIQQEWLPKRHPDRKVLGVIRPTAEHMGALPADAKVFVLATPITVESQSYTRELHKINMTCDFNSVACPRLAEAVEYSVDHSKDPTIYSLCEKYLSTVPKNTQVEMYTGCTHYAFISDMITKLRPNAVVHNQSQIVAEQLVDYLKRHSEVDLSLTKQTGIQPEILCDSGEPRYILKLQKTFTHNFSSV
ncbi:glutamate racemase [Candidatus Woesebacteria bacterium]|nr:glutamate racemase [Candidatus Woesebacteria bacterium]